MEPAKLHDWLQIVGLFGVIASLVFVGLQMKQEQEIALSNAYQTRTDISVQHIGQMMGSPGFAAGFAKLRRGDGQSLSSEERHLQFLNSMAWFNIFENAHYQYVNGFLSEEHWQRSRAALKSHFYGSTRAEDFRATKSTWRPSFGEVVEQLISEVESEQAAQ